MKQHGYGLYIGFGLELELWLWLGNPNRLIQQIYLKK